MKSPSEAALEAAKLARDLGLGEAAEIQAGVAAYRAARLGLHKSPSIGATAHLAERNPLTLESAVRAALADLTDKERAILEKRFNIPKERK